MQKEVGTARPSAGQQVLGGYVLVTVPQLLLIWWLYKERHLQLLDVRVWLACVELKKRRRFLKPGRTPSFALPELQRLVGGGLSRLRAALRRLQALGLVTWNKASLDLACSPDEIELDDLAGFWQLLDKVQNNRRKVPIPRRILRFLAGGATKVTIATVLGHLLRCLYLRGQKLNSVGNCFASFVEDVFGVSETNVHSARQRLVALGMLKEHATEQWHKNRYGARVEVNLAWGSAEGNGKPESRPPLVDFHNTITTPYRENRKLLSEGSNNQNPGALPLAPKSGVFQTKEQEQQKASKQAAPSLRHLAIEDLRDPERLLELHAAAVAERLVPSGERGQLEFFALAEHARRYATRNAPGLMAQLIRNYSSWGRRFINQDDEEAARQRLRDVMRPEPRALSDTRLAVQVDQPERSPQPVGALLDVLLANVQGNRGSSSPTARCAENATVWQ